MRIRKGLGPNEIIEYRRLTSGGQWVQGPIPLGIAMEIVARANNKTWDEKDEEFGLDIDGNFKFPIDPFDFEGEIVPPPGGKQKIIKGKTASRRKVEPGDTKPQRP